MIACYLGSVCGVRARSSRLIGGRVQSGLCCQLFNGSVLCQKLALEE